jgi:membrane protease YdiL (CAAX protease family)
MFSDPGVTATGTAARGGSSVSPAVLGLLAAATIPVWIVVFVWTPLNFWYVMALGTGGLALAGTIAAPGAVRERLRFRASDVVIGVVSAAVLYAVFVVGREMTTRLLPFANDQIGAVYDNKALLAPARIGLLIGLVIGPGEELFWRGFLQRELEARLGGWRGYALATLLYAAVHVFTGNVMLVVAALTAGLLWGGMFLRFGRLWPGIISHVVWDLTVFLLVPLG